MEKHICYYQQIPYGRFVICVAPESSVPALVQGVGVPKGIETATWEDVAVLGIIGKEPESIRRWRDWLPLEACIFVGQDELSAPDPAKYVGAALARAWLDVARKNGVQTANNVISGEIVKLAEFADLPALHASFAEALGSAVWEMTRPQR